MPFVWIGRHRRPLAFSIAGIWWRDIDICAALVDFSSRAIRDPERFSDEFCATRDAASREITIDFKVLCVVSGTKKTNWTSQNSMDEYREISSAIVLVKMQFLWYLRSIIFSSCFHWSSVGLRRYGSSVCWPRRRDLKVASVQASNGMQYCITYVTDWEKNASQKEKKAIGDNVNFYRNTK